MPHVVALFDHTPIATKNMNTHNKGKNAKLEIFSTFNPLNYVLKIFGLSYIHRNGEEINCSNSFLKACLLAISFTVINIFTVYIKLRLQDSIVFSFKESFELSYLFGYFQYIVDIICVYKYGRQSLIGYISHYEYIDDLLGMPYYNRSKTDLIIINLIFTVLSIICAVTDFVGWGLLFGWTYTTIFFIEYVYLTLRLLGALDLITHTIQLTYRLKTIGDLLRNFYDEGYHLAGVDMISGGKSNLLNLKVVSYNRHNIVLWLSRCYLLLTDQCEFINTMFGFRILHSCTVYLIDMVLLLNFIIRMLIDSHDINYSCLPIIAMFMRAVTATLILLFCFYRCEQNYRESKNIIRLIDDLVINKKTTKEIQEKLKEFKELIISRPICHHAKHFYKLDYSALVSQFSVIATYTIILLQNMK